MTGGRYRALLPAAVLLLALFGSCSDDIDSRGRSGSSTSSTSATPCARPSAGTCTLRAAAASRGRKVGTALKLGDRRRRLIQAEQFSAASSEIEFLWNVIHPERDRWDFTGADRVVAFAERHHLEFTATHLVWDPPSNRSVLPDWVRQITDPDELRSVLRDHMKMIADRYGSRIDRLMVVNEPLDDVGELERDQHFRRVLGPGYVAESLRMADELFPRADLVVNDYNLEYFRAKARGMVRLVRSLQGDGVPVDEIGFQGHLFFGEPDWQVLESAAAGIEGLGLDWSFTEIDAPRVPVARDKRFTRDQQAAWVSRMVAICLGSRSCRRITFWGFDDGDTWLTDQVGGDAEPLLYDADLRPKPLYDAVRDTLVEGAR